MLRKYSKRFPSSVLFLRARSVKPMMAFIGVRMSWLMLKRKYDFALLAASASSRALSSMSCFSSSSCMRASTSRKAMT